MNVFAVNGNIELSTKRRRWNSTHAEDKKPDHQPHDSHCLICDSFGNFRRGLAAFSGQQGPGNLRVVSDQLSLLFVISVFYHAQLQSPVALFAIRLWQRQKLFEDDRASGARRQTQRTASRNRRALRFRADQLHRVSQNRPWPIPASMQNSQRARPSTRHQAKNRSGCAEHQAVTLGRRTDHHRRARYRCIKGIRCDPRSAQKRRQETCARSRIPVQSRLGFAGTLRTATDQAGEERPRRHTLHRVQPVFADSDIARQNQLTPRPRLCTDRTRTGLMNPTENPKKKAALNRPPF